MRSFADTVTEIDFPEKDRKLHKNHLADCIVLTQDKKILLQFRPEWKENPPYLSAFGGHVEPNETIIQGLLREMKEELGVKINENDVIKIHTLTEDFTNHKDAVHVFFWHDKRGEIKGCFEHFPVYFKTVEDALQHPNIMDYLGYSLIKCQNLGYIA